MGLLRVSGTKIFIGTALADKYDDFTEADFPTSGAGEITWTEIGATEDLGTIGDKSDVDSVKLLSVNRVKKLPGGPNDAGSMALVCALDPADAGQLALAAAQAACTTYAFKVQFKDAPAGGTPSLRYFVGIVSGCEEAYGNDGEMKLNVAIEISSNIVKVAAASGT